VLVETQIQEFALVFAALRAAKGIDARNPDTRRTLGQRVWIAGGVLHFVSQERSDVASYRVREPHDDRTFRLIDQLVESIGAEPVKEADVGVVGDEAHVAGGARAEPRPETWERAGRSRQRGRLPTQRPRSCSQAA